MNLATTYMGMSLKNPVVASASPISKSLDGIRSLEDAGAAAVVMYSLFEEQIQAESDMLDHYLEYGAHSFAEAITYFPNLQNYNVGPDEYLNLIRKAKTAVGIPVVGSLNGISANGWASYAKKIEQAGADGLELNMYVIPADPRTPSIVVEQLYLDALEVVKSAVSIPVALKLSPFFSATANVAHRLDEAGADALVLFNRFYQPDIDVENLEVVPHLVLSDPWEQRLPLRWIAILYGRVKADLALTTGVYTHEEVLKGLMAGAKVTMMASALLHHGVGRIGEVLAGLEQWMETHEYESVRQMQGSMSQQHVAEPAAFERANYMKVLQSWRPDPGGRLFAVR